ncbi:MAG: Bifunctional enoyl-CoA hydratase/phosphate acetyltransferase [Candidatus Hydrogenedentes bacterium]|nr:Bifunctional enoyl-CoA hydratase/phosphate acetyltransferase [Candidatus Hydrogenedentota bacterium]
MTPADSPLRTFDELLSRARRTPPPRMAVAAAGEPAVIEAVAHAAREGLIHPILVGAPGPIRAMADEQAMDLTGIDLIETDDPAEASALAVKLVHDGGAELVMKGLVRTKDFLKAVLNQAFGMRRGRPLSQVALFESQDRSRLILLTDSGINIHPRFSRKIAIIQNALELAYALGIDEPKVAVIAAIETVELPAMPATLDAELLRRMGAAGQFGRCVIDGPLAMDNALDSHTAETKGRSSAMAGNADIIVVPEIETGNAVYKTIRYIAGRDLASIVMGAAGPVVVTSRSDSANTKLYSIALGALMSQQRGNH